MVRNEQDKVVSCLPDQQGPGGNQQLTQLLTVITAVA